MLKAILRDLLEADYEIANGRYRFRRIYTERTGIPITVVPLQANGGFGTRLGWRITAGSSTGFRRQAGVVYMTDTGQGGLTSLTR
ncbi:MAG: hypothetical protein KGN84_00155 [Acidobacteriota bacterium]|nr:hypothetical protein [Acidobacteriota bacterium]